MKRVYQVQEIAPVDSEFVRDVEGMIEVGRDIAGRSAVEIIGLARNCEPYLILQAKRIACLAANFRSARVRVVENDSTDRTAELLKGWRSEDFTIEAQCQTHNAGPFFGRGDDRTNFLAARRTDVSNMVQECDYVFVLDFDVWSWSPDRVIAGLGELWCDPGAAGVASQGLARHYAMFEERWFGYDAWAWRPSYSWQHRPQHEVAYHLGNRPVGAPAQRVNSAFGGMAMYRYDQWRTGTYKGGDCEHVPFHRSIAEATGKWLLESSTMTHLSWWESRD